MNLIEIIDSAGGDAVIRQLATKFGLDETQARRAIDQLLPALTRGMQRNAKSQGGMDALIGALQSGGHDRYLDDPGALAQDVASADGNAILGHVLGSKDASRNVASHAAAQTGIDANTLKGMLPLLASVAMGALSKQTGQGNALRTAPSASSGSGAFDMLNSMLDADKDGSAVDDLIDLAKKFF